jgi:hypothetical protein
VCAHPLNWREEFDSDIDETLQQKHVVGMYVKLFCDSDSGDVKDLRGAMIKELLDFSARPKEPPFHYYPFDVSDYQLAIALGTDRHTILFPDDSPDADWIIPQLSVYKCLHCGCTDIVQLRGHALSAAACVLQRNHSADRRRGDLQWHSRVSGTP